MLIKYLFEGKKEVTQHGLQNPIQGILEPCDLIERYNCEKKRVLRWPSWRRHRVPSQTSTNAMQAVDYKELVLEELLPSINEHAEGFNEEISADVRSRNTKQDWLSAPPRVRARRWSADEIMGLKRSEISKGIAVNTLRAAASLQDRRKLCSSSVSLNSLRHQDSTDISQTTTLRMISSRNCTKTAHADRYWDWYLRNANQTWQSFNSDKTYCY